MPNNEHGAHLIKMHPMPFRVSALQTKHRNFYWLKYYNTVHQNWNLAHSVRYINNSGEAGVEQKNDNRLRSHLPPV